MNCEMWIGINTWIHSLLGYNHRILQQLGAASTQHWQCLELASAYCEFFLHSICCFRPLSDLICRSLGCPITDQLKALSAVTTAHSDL